MLVVNNVAPAIWLYYGLELCRKMELWKQFLQFMAGLTCCLV